tara:strand:- start:16 stop:351 length:336 start_codon:yes stop_codon:yes gene_type:complete
VVKQFLSQFTHLSPREVVDVEEGWRENQQDVDVRRVEPREKPPEEPREKPPEEPREKPPEEPREKPRDVLRERSREKTPEEPLEGPLEGPPDVQRERFKVDAQFTEKQINL